MFYILFIFRYGTVKIILISVILSLWVWKNNISSIRKLVTSICSVLFDIVQCVKIMFKIILSLRVWKNNLDIHFISTEVSDEHFGILQCVKIIFISVIVSLRVWKNNIDTHFINTEVSDEPSGTVCPQRIDKFVISNYILENKKEYKKVDFHF